MYLLFLRRVKLGQAAKHRHFRLQSQILHPRYYTVPKMRGAAPSPSRRDTTSQNVLGTCCLWLIKEVVTSEKRLASTKSEKVEIVTELQYTSGVSSLRFDRKLMMESRQEKVRTVKVQQNVRLRPHQVLMACGFCTSCRIVYISFFPKTLSYWMDYQLMNGS